MSKLDKFIEVEENKRLQEILNLVCGKGYKHRGGHGLIKNEKGR